MNGEKWNADAGVRYVAKGGDRVSDVEREALLLERAAVIRVVSALRRYRAACAELLNARYADGEVDAVALSRFQQTLSEINEETYDTDQA